MRDGAGVLVFMTWPIPEPGTSFEEWQAGRCANCGASARSSLVRDHDHATGLERGLLCRGCNTHEGVSAAPHWVRWRSGWNPAALLGADQMYDAGWREGMWDAWERLNPEPTEDELRAAINLLGPVA